MKYPIRWLCLACAAVWLFNLAVCLNQYFQRLGRGIPPEELAPLRFECVKVGLLTAIWLLAFFLLSKGRKKPVGWLVRALLLTGLTVIWAALYPLAAAADYSAPLWFLELAVAAGTAVYCFWRYRHTCRTTRTQTQDEIV